MTSQRKLKSGSTKGWIISGNCD